MTLYTLTVFVADTSQVMALCFLYMIWEDSVTIFRVQITMQNISMLIMSCWLYLYFCGLVLT